MENVISISPTGVLMSIYNDGLSLGELGNQEVTRASLIEWSIEDQSWRIKWTNNPKQVIQKVYTGFKSYEEARNFEVKVLAECIKHSVEPASLVGHCIAMQLRYK